MIYLDNSATTQLCQAAKDKIISTLDLYGNPSSRHTLGLQSKKTMDIAREKIGKTLGLTSLNLQNLIFTASGTEANNMAILGSVYSKERKQKGKIITTNSEHSSVENVMRKLENDGFEVVRLSTENGALDIEEFKMALDNKTILVSLMMVNNETGALYDTKKFFTLAKKLHPQIITHCDAVQGYLKTKFTPMSIGADLLSISGHKVHAPKGVGALYISKDIKNTKKIVPYILGGGQEFGYRSGTENLLGISAFGESAETLYKKLDSDILKMQNLREYACTLLEDTEACINQPQTQAPHIISITLPYIKSEVMLNHLSQNEICISAGSACATNSRHISNSLLGFGLDTMQADCTVRVSLCAENTREEIDIFCQKLVEGMDKLVRIKK